MKIAQIPEESRDLHPRLCSFHALRPSSASAVEAARRLRSDALSTAGPSRIRALIDSDRRGVRTCAQPQSSP